MQAPSFQDDKYTFALILISVHLHSPCHFPACCTPLLLGCQLAKTTSVPGPMRLRLLLAVAATLLPPTAAASSRHGSTQPPEQGQEGGAPPAQCPSSSTSPLHVANTAGVQVFAHSEDGYNCTRIPTVILADGVLLAIAEGR